MSITHPSDDMVALPAVLDLNNIAAVKALLLEQLEKSEDVTIDCSMVTRVTTPAVQILLSYAKTIAIEGRRPQLHNPSEAFRTAFSDLGLQDQLSQWSTS